MGVEEKGVEEQGEEDKGVEEEGVDQTSCNSIDNRRREKYNVASFTLQRQFRPTG